MSEPESASAAPHRIALTLEYDGGAFNGWQRQLAPAVSTIQQEVESALSRIADHPVSVICAGRTDAGVHATCQVIHFDSAIDRGEKAWVMGANSLLPRTVRILSATAVQPDFHARFSAQSRRYLYLIYQRQIASAIMHKRVTHVPQLLDVEAMNTAAQSLLGEQDFTSFRAAGCQSKSSFRNVMRAEVSRRGAFVIFDIQANAFLQHMVRNIVGALLEVGGGRQDSTWIAQLLAQRDRTLAAITAPPDGLYLVQVGYPEHYDIPAGAVRPGFLE